MPKRIIKGKVVSDNVDKTVVVAVETRDKHPLYHKVVSRTTKYKAHDEKNECGIGDQVVIEESKPISRDKTWVVKEITARAA